ncbi:MAG: gliding motility-associated ABC transporter substrate-binding protein GldG [Paludibacteraceae bacterium]|nr:gliding motility-associated ABC transporter substrate-binding protein GldG [Paludibacteraceae bacterium]MBN2788190.1 gliding motility-associated ABC transporter substrate-binding protein GldG [Paludibacteraceae bacterium]
MKNNSIRTFLIVIIGIVLLNTISAFLFFRLDLTSEKRYSISDNTKKMLSGLNNKTHIKIYLDGDLNPGFLRLKKSTAELLDEFKVYASTDFSYEFINPSEANSAEARNKNYITMERRGMRAFTIYEKDDEGKAIQKVVFPWAEITYGKDTAFVNLLKNNPRLSGTENLNHSIENLEFELTDAIRIKAIKTTRKIAFLEGHNELPPEMVYDASVSLSKYFQVDRGALNNNPSILKEYQAIIIAKPETAFSEQEKFIIDQYIMNGGKVLWLLDGVRLAMDSLSTVGISPVIPLNINLDDQLFKYGVRIAPVLLQDMQCTQVPINVARPDEEAKFEPMPWYYSPLLLASPNHTISRNITEVKADFASALDLTVSQNSKVKKTILLVTSNATHVEMTPSRIDLNNMYDIDSKTYFNAGYIPIAAALEGVFPSVFTNRLVPEGIISNGEIKKESKPTRMIVVADGDIIRNDLQGDGENLQLLPMGFDRYAQREYGNRSFILNSILYLTDDEGWLQLRSREFKIRTLNKKVVVSEKKKWQLINVALPLILLLLFALIYTTMRRKVYTH